MLDDADEIRRTFRRAVTDSGNDIAFSDDPARAGVNNILGIYKVVTGMTEREAEADFAGARGYGDLKSRVAEAVIEQLATHQAPLPRVDGRRRRTRTPAGRRSRAGRRRVVRQDRRDEEPHGIPAAMSPERDRLAAYYPPLEEFERLAGGGANLVPVYREIDGDLETPVSAYLKVARPPYSFLLESVEGGERMARYSFIGTEPIEVIKTGKGEALGDVDPLLPIEQALSRYTMADAPYLGKFNGGAVGYLSYEAATHFERLPTPEGDGLGLPESVMMLTTTFLEFDHVRHRIRVVSHGHVDGDVERAYFEAVERIEEIVARLEAPLPAEARGGNGALNSWGVSSNVNRETYEENVERVKRYVVRGDVIQVVPSQRLARPTEAHPFQIYRALRNVNPSPYMYYLNLDGFPDSRRVPRNAGAGGQRRRQHRPHRPAPAPGARRPPRTTRWSANSRPTRRSAPNTSCCWTSAGTTWAASANRAPSRSWT